MRPPLPHDVAAAAAALPRPCLLGLTGSPGVGKSTLAAALAAAHDGVVAPLDGFHLADVELERRGLRDVKGAPETFDAAGLAALLERVRARDELVMAPAFERTLEQPVAGALPLPPDAGLVVVEGNYLLLPDDPWPRVRARLDVVWHLVVDPGLRDERAGGAPRRVGQGPGGGPRLGRPRRHPERPPRGGGGRRRGPRRRPHRLALVTPRVTGAPRALTAD